MSYNKTQLNPELSFEKHIFHRDQFAHYLRWTHVLKEAKIGMNILDFGCGSGNLAEVLYRNRFKANKYLGLDIRKKTIEKANEKFKKVDWINFMEADLCEGDDYDLDFFRSKINWDMICSFEVIEHIGKKNINKFLQNIKTFMNPNTILLISTPVYDSKVGAAANHIIDGVVGELTFTEMKEVLETNGFKIEKVFGTFASQKDYKPLMSDEQKAIFESLSEYYDVNLMSVLMAPMFPMQSRNCLWCCRLNVVGEKNGRLE